MPQPSLFDNVTGVTPPLSLSGLTQLVSATIARNPSLRNVWIVAELTDVRSSGGHGYMGLIEKDITGQTIARLRAMIWRNKLPELRRKFFAATGRDIATGLKVMVKGDVNHHPLYGMSFTINDIDPSYTLGDMERLRREILQTLSREGIIDMQHRLRVPIAPQKIAVISAAGAAGYGDFINQLENNSFGYKFYPMLFPAVMQGTSVSPTIISALARIEQSVDAWDCVVIIRGGGSSSDLNGFDDLKLARAVVTFPLPVYVGIGHERDNTVLDDIACVRCKTPTAVAANLIENLHHCEMHMQSMVQNILAYSADSLAGEQQRIANIQTRLPMLAITAIERNHKIIEQLTSRLQLAEKSAIGNAATTLQRFDGRIGVATSRTFARAESTLRLQQSRIFPAADRVLTKASDKIKALRDMVRILDPANTLRRGYSITRVNGKAIKDTLGIKPGDNIVTTLASGSISATVTETSESNKNCAGT